MDVDAGNARWSAPRWRDLVWAQWEVNYSVFDGGTGETHLLNELPAEMLRILADSPRAGTELAGMLALACGVEEDAAWREKILALLSNLYTLDLIAPEKE